ncbi:MAG: NADH-quinone oxidoreductase subunit L [Dehalococcoidia bacterium]|nr:NADH-quinone oxidoreductase subunit L [Dehalococcoidia bacterium]
MIAAALPLVPLAASGLLLVLRGHPRSLGPVAVAALAITLALGGLSAATEPSLDWGWGPAIRTGLAVEGFSRVMVVLVPAMATPIVAYAAVTEEEGRLRLLVLMLAFTGAMLLLVSAADFLMLLTAWELVGAASWALIGHGWRDSGNSRAATQAFLTTRIGDLGIYFAAGVLFAASGSFAFSGVGGVDGWQQDAIAAGVLLAAAAKSAQVPFSPWLFAAMAGPTPVSALLHSATLVAAGAYLLIRLAPGLEAVGWLTPAVAGIGLTTALSGGLVATIQTNAKRVLAGSTSAQYGLMFVAVGASSTAAAGAHLVTHAAFKSLLFLGAGIAIHASGSQDLAAMRLGRVLPRIALLSAVGALALAAVPPLGGAWSKEEILAAAVHASPWLATGVFVAGFLSALYATRYQALAFGPGPGPGREAHPVAPRHLPGRWESASLAALAAATAGLALLWLPRASRLVEGATGGALVPSASWELVVSIATLAFAIAIAWLLWRNQRLVTLGLPGSVQQTVGDWLGLPAATRLFVIAPVTTASHLLARFDDRVIDAGVRAVAALASAVSRLFSLRAEWTIDGAVRGAAGATLRAAQGSRVTDDAGIDGTVEGTAWVIGLAGQQSRRLQTGLAHHYYVIVTAGFATTVALLALFAWGNSL